MAERSIPDELTDETNGNVFVVILSYVIMFIYISIGIGSIWIGIIGITIIILSIICGIGLTTFMGLCRFLT